MINELYHMGGAEMQTLREIGLLRQKGHEVYHISCDSSIPEGWSIKDNKHYNIGPDDKSQMNWHVKRIKRFFINKKFESQLKSLIGIIKPDIIHINNMTYEPVTVYGVLKKWKSVQTIRDFGAICPNELCITTDYKACNGYHCGKCMKTCAPSNPKKQKLYFSVDRFYLKRVNKIRNKGIDIFLSPSEYLAKTCTKNAIKTTTLNNSFDFSVIEGFKKEKLVAHKVYLTYGLLARHKGTMLLIEAFKEFSVNNDVELKIIGKLAPEFRAEFNEAIKNEKKISYLGEMPYKEVIDYLSGIYVVVVPSLWLENYPNTALEGLATKCLILGTNRGGIPELIADKRFAFDVLNKADIVNKLQYSYGLTVKEYESIVDSNYNRVIHNNGLDKYYERILNVFQELLNI